MSHQDNDSNNVSVSSSALWKGAFSIGGSFLVFLIWYAWNIDQARQERIAERQRIDTEELVKLRDRVSKLEGIVGAKKAD